jgi:hypothetical protein
VQVAGEGVTGAYPVELREAIMRRCGKPWPPIFPLELAVNVSPAHAIAQWNPHPTEVVLGELLISANGTGVAPI